MTIIEHAGRLIEAATGNEYGDGSMVTDMGVGYADRGEGDDRVWVTGNWNDKRRPREGEPAPTKEERLPSRLAAALEWIGVECEWSDQNESCNECYRLIRTSPDSYGWTLDGLWCDGYVCGDCARTDIDAYLQDSGFDGDGYINQPTRAITFCSERNLAEIGFTQWESTDPHEYENGWHPGQTDDPAKIYEAIREVSEDDVVFHISDVGQFDVRFTAWTRPVNQHDA